MGYFNRDSNNRAGRDNRGGGRGFGRSNDGPREMFKTVCSNCGKDCEVPFKPTNGKPVYCSECFEKMGGRNTDFVRPERGDRFNRPERPERNRSDFGSQAPRIDNSKQFSDLNTKLDKIIALLTPKIESVVEEIKVEKVVKTPKVKKEKVIKEDK